MKLISLSCNNCGGPLEVPESTKFITCSYCKSKLKVKQSGNAIYSEVLEKINESVKEITEDIEILKLQNELERLDREWDQKRSSLMIKNKDGSTHKPTKTSALMGVVPIVFAIFWMSMASNMGAPPFFMMFGLVFIFFGIVMIFSTSNKAEKYEKLYNSYQLKRERLVRKIEQG